MIAKFLVATLLVACFSAKAGTEELRLPPLSDDSAQYKVPQPYKDSGTGILFYVESDGRHIAAIDADNHVLWVRNPFVDAQLKPYRFKTPKLTHIGPASNITQHPSEHFLGISFTSSQFGILDERTGDFTFRGQD